jgi:hypothetical protein
MCRAAVNTGTEQRRDLRAIAKLLIARYGVKAHAHAAHQALKARERGDERTMNAWRRIAVAVEELLRSEPEDENAG